jgi:hypothetical protein
VGDNGIEIGTLRVLVLRTQRIRFGIIALEARSLGEDGCWIRGAAG